MSCSENWQVQNYCNRSSVEGCEGWGSPDWSSLASNTIWLVRQRTNVQGSILGTGWMKQRLFQMTKCVICKNWPTVPCTIQRKWPKTTCSPGIERMKVLFKWKWFCVWFVCLVLKDFVVVETVCLLMTLSDNLSAGILKRAQCLCGRQVDSRRCLWANASAPFVRFNRSTKLVKWENPAQMLSKCVFSNRGKDWRIMPRLQVPVPLKLMLFLSVVALSGICAQVLIRQGTCGTKRISVRLSCRHYLGVNRHIKTFQIGYPNKSVSHCNTKHVALFMRSEVNRECRIDMGTKR